MGGSALKATKTRRYLKEEFEAAKAIIVPIVAAAFDTKVHVPRYYPNKESFGDLDILVYNDNINDFIGPVKENFAPQQIFKNGSILSFDWNELQVDLIFVNKNNWEPAKFFFGDGDFGTILGVFFKKFGLSLGFDGLYYKSYSKDNSRMLGKIVISKDPAKILEFIGLDIAVYNKGFEKPEDMFKFVTSSPYFSKAFFSPSVLSHHRKKENYKRKVYLEFLDYVETVEDGILFSSIPDFKTGELMTFVDSFFPESQLIATVNELLEVDKNKRLLKDKFNGKDVMELTGLTGADMGRVFEAFKSSVGDFDIFVSQNSVDHIKNVFAYFYKNLK